jgi:hypothetical protein
VSFKEALKYSFFLIVTILVTSSSRPLLYLIITFFNTHLSVFLKVLNIVFSPTGSVGLRLSTPLKAVTNYLARVRVSTSRSADNKIIIGGYKGVKMPFYKSTSCKVIG